ncbi:hypothetical protein DL96DRAFT_655532 [Flagelloscypha sp. PMI_526]|nr:hypothetical protein DL96DRAFT_655532 [Flagelloscypha sp. PMI_526]
MSFLTVENLMRRVAWLIRSIPDVLYLFNDILPDGHAILFASTQEVQVAVLLSPNGANIYDLHNSFHHLDYPASSSILRKRLWPSMSSELWESWSALQPPLTDCVLQIMQWELDNCFDDRKYRNLCLHLMRKLAKAQGVLPLELYIRNAVREGNHPITGGGFADIWQGRIGDTRVCLKVLRIFTTDSIKEKIIKEFCHESIVWRQLHHPNVLPFLGVSKDLFAPSFCLISPFMEHGNILTFLEKNPNHDRIVCLKQIAEGLKYLHSQCPRIVHGDIRGANILVQDNLVCCLADFGLALVSESQALDSSSGPIRGATRWLGPELIDPRKFENATVDATKRDIYAFACTVVEIFTGKPPFSHHRMDSAVIHDVLSGVRPERPREPYPMPDALWNVVTECWAEFPNMRPTIEQVLPWVCADPPLEDRRWDMSNTQTTWEEPSWVELVDGWLDAQSVHSQHSRSASPKRLEQCVPNVDADTSSTRAIYSGRYGEEVEPLFAPDQPPTIFPPSNNVADEPSLPQLPALRRRPARKRTEVVPDVQFTPPKRPRPTIKTHRRTDAVLPPSPQPDNHPQTGESFPEEERKTLVPPQAPFMGHLRRNLSADSNVTTASSGSSDSRRWGWAPGAPGSEEWSSLTSASPPTSSEDPLPFSRRPSPFNGETEYQVELSDLQQPRPPPTPTIPTFPQDYQWRGPQISLEDTTSSVIPIILQRKGGNAKDWSQYVMVITYGPPEQRTRRYLRDDEQPVKVIIRLRDNNLNPECRLQNISTLRSPVFLAAIKNEARLLRRHNRSASEEPGQSTITKFHKRTLSTPDPLCSYAVAIYPFVAERPGQIDVEVDDRFIILSKNDACCTVQTDLTGIMDYKAGAAVEGIAPPGCFLQLTMPFANATRLAAKANPEFVSSNGFAPILPHTIMSSTFAGTVLRDFNGRGYGELSVNVGTSLFIYKKYLHWSYVVIPGTGERGWVPSWIITRVQS